MTRRTSRKRTSLRRNSNPGGVVVGDIVRSSVFSGQAKVKKIVGAMADVKHEYGGTFPVSLDSLFVEPKGTKFGRSLRRNSSRRSNSGNPKPKFKLGDRVHWMDGRKVLDTGEVSFVGDYDAYLGQYRYRLKSDNGISRRFTNESSLRLVKGRKRSALRTSLRRNSLRPPTWENYNEDTGVVLDRFSSRLDAVREAEDWRRSGHRVSSRKIGLRSNSRRRTSLRRNSADWSTRTAVAAKARAAFARGDSRSANRYLSELSAIDLAMMPRAVRRNGRRRTSRRRTSRR